MRLALRMRLFEASTTAVAKKPHGSRPAKTIRAYGAVPSEGSPYPNDRDHNCSMIATPLETSHNTPPAGITPSQAKMRLAFFGHPLTVVVVRAHARRGRPRG